MRLTITAFVALFTFLRTTVFDDIITLKIWARNRSQNHAANLGKHLAILSFISYISRTLPAEELDIIRTIDDYVEWVSTHKKDHIPNYLPVSLKEAIRAFVLTSDGQHKFLS